jgi:predicted DNA-binding protein YlxM (UPF0122 family)
MKVSQLTGILVKAGGIMDLRISEIAALTGYSRSTVYKWIKKRDPSLAQYVDWAEALGYEVVLIRKAQIVAPDDTI